jgi:HK97 family phage major capsid protein
LSDTLEEIKQKADDAFGNLETLVAELKSAKEAGDGADRINALADKVDEVANEVAAAKAAQMEAEKGAAADKRLADIEARMLELAKEQRSPSKAAAILGEQSFTDGLTPSDSFFTMLSMVNNPRTPPNVRAHAEKALLDMGSRYVTTDEIAQKIAAEGGSYSKATLGSTDATGGYLAPRAVVAEMTSVQAANNPFRRLLNVVTGIAGPTVETPHLGLSATRAVVVARGETKTNASLSFANYTATFYTLAVIHDAANQWLRQTRGQGERVIRQRGAEAIASGEAYYVLQGSGSSEPKGLLTSIGGSGTFVTTHSSPSTSTIAGNFATAIANAAGAIAGRNRRATGVVMNGSDFWLSLASGANDAGYYLAPGGANTIDATGAFNDGDPAMRIWGLPVVISNQMPSDSLVVGDFKSADLYIGEDLRIDTSSEAGDRWDKNLTGFRFEEDIAFNADPYVAAGLFQRIVNVMA